MKERPILFSAPMVRAILEGRKTQTRRIKFRCEPGDVLWVREAWDYCPSCVRCDRHNYQCNHQNNGWIYAADELDCPYICKWHPSIHMPRAACRLFLRVKAVREERLRDITEADAEKEGCEKALRKTDGTVAAFARNTFQVLWDGLNAKRGYSWESNPLVTVIEFERIHKEAACK